MIDSLDGTGRWFRIPHGTDLPSYELVWRKKIQFDEGTGTVDSWGEALPIATGTSSSVDQETEARCYRDVVCEQFEEPDMILQHAGTWAEDRVEYRT